MHCLSQEGFPWLSRLMSRERFYDIKRHFCFNGPDEFSIDPQDDNYHPYAEWLSGLQILVQNSRKVIKMGNILSLDESRALNTSPANDNMSFETPKPTRKAVNIFNVAISLQYHSGYVIATKPYCKGHMYDDEKEEEEGKTDNLVRNLVNSTTTANSVYFWDIKFSSMFLNDTLLPSLGNVCCGNVMKTRRHLPTGTNSTTGEKGLFQTVAWQNRTKALKKGEFIQLGCRHNNLCCIKDRGLMYLLDSGINPDKFVNYDFLDDTEVRTVPVPIVFQLYRDNMRFVDVANSHRANFGIEQKSVRKHNNTMMADME